MHCEICSAMTSLLWFLALIFYHSSIGKVDAETISCDNGFVDYKNKELCVSVAQGTKAQHEELCQQYGGKVFKDRMTDEMYEQFGNDLKQLAESISSDLYIGMRRDERTRVWTFTNNKGTVEADKYPFWATDPEYFRCAAMTFGKFKVMPHDCKPAIYALCEKATAPCFHPRMAYTKYLDHCLSASSTKANYSAAEEFCEEGHLFPVTDGPSKGSAVAATYSYPSPVYAALQQQKDGRWLYESGDEETDKRRFESGSPVTENCGCYGLNPNGRIKILFTNCETQLRPICEKKRS